MLYYSSYKNLLKTLMILEAERISSVKVGLCIFGDCMLC